MDVTVDALLARLAQLLDELEATWDALHGADKRDELRTRQSDLDRARERISLID